MKKIRLDRHGKCIFSFWLMFVCVLPCSVGVCFDAFKLLSCGDHSLLRKAFSEINYFHLRAVSYLRWQNENLCSLLAYINFKLNVSYVYRTFKGYCIKIDECIKCKKKKNVVQISDNNFFASISSNEKSNYKMMGKIVFSVSHCLSTSLTF